MMPRNENSHSISGAELEVSPPTSFGGQIDLVTAFLRRRYLSILVCTLVALPIGAFILFTTPSTYTASAVMMIETRKSPLPGLAGADAPVDAGWIESQIGIMKSQNVASYVV